MVLLNGNALTLEDVERVACADEPVHIAPEALERMTASRHVVEHLAAGEAPVYAVNTGVGLLAHTRIPPDNLEQLQHNIVRSHACGVGDPLPRETVRAMMLIRANVLAKGFSGIRPAVAERLCEFLNRGITPVVPSRGSVGASGDLAPLAHVALALIGEGPVIAGGVRRTASEVIAPLHLAAKEGVSLVNGTQAMLAAGALDLLAAERLADAADVACALSLDALRGTPRAFDPRIHAVRPHPGQQSTAARLVRLLEGSEIRASHATCLRVQDAYSLRCAPQVHGAVRDTLAKARQVFSIEMNSATDNPLVFGNETFSGGNFHGQYLALELDYLAIALTALAGISERRIERLVNPSLNEGLPAFLAANPGLESGLMMLQVTAAAMIAECRVLSTPASPGSVTTSGNKEDFVSMGMTAALKFRQLQDSVRTVIAIEMICAVRALHYLRPLKTSPLLEPVRAELEALAPPDGGDQPSTDAIQRIGDLIRRWKTPETG
ncbi:MAG: histidine ammonia-lyase [Bryobacterales bacterium]|nr:histidine ammonia-lyase [Bryobacterales bacterium]